ncbi:hypothetical protein QU38_01970, partial [Staphylococcus aureus]
GGRRAGDARGIEAGLLRQRHDRHQPAIAGAPDADALRIGMALGDQIADAALEIVDVGLAIAFILRLVVLAPLPPGAADVDGQDDMALRDQILVEPPGRVGAAPAPLVAHRVRIDRADDHRIFLRGIEIGGDADPAEQVHPVDMAGELDIARPGP